MKGKFIKKLTAYALTAAMVVSTPMTAFASEFADNFWVSDGVEEHDPMDTGTGTVSSTNTNTGGVVIGANIKGISICLKGETSPKSSLVIDKGTASYAELTAKVDYEDESSLSADEKAKINQKITWRSSDLQIVRPKADYTNRENCRITAYKGGFATITAEMDLDNDGSADYAAKVMVMVKKKPTEIHLNIPTLYAGHTYDLMEYVSFGESDEYDTVTFKLEGLDVKQQKLVTFGNDGVLKLDKKIKTNMTAKITATVGTLSTDQDVTLSLGVPVTGLKFVDKKPTYDIADNYDKTTYKIKPLKDRQVKKLQVTVNTKGGTTTDDITWSSSDNRVVRVTSKVLRTDKNDGKPFTEVTFEGLSVGKATVTATSTSGKSAKVTVTVSATLLTLQASEKDAPYVSGDSTWSGKATPIVINRVPKQNKDKLKVTITDKTEKKIVKAKAGINPVLTPAADLVKLNADGAEIKTVKIEAANKKLNVPAVTVKQFKVNQSDVELASVVAGKTSGDMDKKTVKINSNRILTYFATATAAHNTPGVEAVSWASSKETVATVDNGTVNVVGEGSAKITVSSVYLKDAAKKKYATSKKTFTIKSTPKCEAIELKSDIVTVKAGKDAVINIKQQLPKKAADNVTWYIYKANKDGVMEASPVTKDKKTNDKKCTISTSGYSAGDVITVVAMAGSAQVQAKIVVLPAK